MCIFIFIGLDVAGTGRRWKSMFGVISFVFATIAIFGIGTVVTLAQPFYLLVSVFNFDIFFQKNKF